MDVLTVEQRKENMQHIRSKDTSIEVALRKALWHKGYRYRKNYKKLPGSPDIVFAKHRIAIFCDSEFFHGKDWWDVKRPKILNSKNSDYWINKIEQNMQRDIENDQRLLLLGWTVIHFWGQEILKDINECIKVIEETIIDNMALDMKTDESEY